MSPDKEISDVDTACTKPTLKDFQGVKNNILRRILYLLMPCGLIAGIFLVGLWQGFNQALYAYATLIAAVILTIWFFKDMMEDIPLAMNILWSRGILAKSRNSGEDFPLNQSSERAYREDFRGFMRDIERSLNSRTGQILFGALFSVTLLCRSIYDISMWLGEDLSQTLLFNSGGLDTCLWAAYLYINYYITAVLTLWPLRFLTGFILEPLIGLFLGLIAWRMLVTGWQISKMHKRFDLNPRLRDPDKCGGLEPLGNLCLHNAKIVGVWGAFLGLWIILGVNYNINSFYVPLLTKLLVLPLILALASFFLPLWRVHSSMLEKKAELGTELDQIARIIDEISRKRLNSVCNPEQIGSEGEHFSRWAAEQDQLQKIYEESLNFPVWPFNYQILVKFLTSQFVPILGLTGLGGPLLNVIRSLMDFLNKTGGT